MRHAMPCGTVRREPVQILKITPVLPGAITEKEPITLTRTITAARPVRTLLVILASCSGESRMVLMCVVFLLGCVVGRELGHVDHVRAPVRPPARECAQEAAFEPPLERAEQEVDPDPSGHQKRDLCG